MDGKIRSFTQLIAWQQGHKLVLAVYSATKKFPSTEQFGLSSQILRAVVSITSNIAEGFGRKSEKEKCNFYYMSLGSLAEVQNQLLIAKDLSYISKSEFEFLSSQTVVVAKLLSGLIKSIKMS